MIPHTQPFHLKDFLCNDVIWKNIIKTNQTVKAITIIIVKLLIKLVFMLCVILYRQCNAAENTLGALNTMFFIVMSSVIILDDGLMSITVRYYFSFQTAPMSGTIVFCSKLVINDVIGKNEIKIRMNDCIVKVL